MYIPDVPVQNENETKNDFKNLTRISDKLTLNVTGLVLSSKEHFSETSCSMSFVDGSEMIMIYGFYNRM